MKTLTKIFVFCVAILGSVSLVQARTLIPLQNFEHITVARLDGKVLDLAEMKTRVTMAAQGVNWVISPGLTDNILVATTVVRNKHTVRVTIDLGKNAFSVKYLDSINMKYSVEQPSADQDPLNYGKAQSMTAIAVIHPAYNQWVSKLIGAIRMQLQQ